MKTQYPLKLHCNGRPIKVLTFSGKCMQNGIKLKKDSIGTRVYDLFDGASPPYTIIYYLPKVELTVTIVCPKGLTLDDLSAATFTLTGISWLRGCTLSIRELRCLDIVGSIKRLEISFIPQGLTAQPPQEVPA